MKYHASSLPSRRVRFRRLVRDMLPPLGVKGLWRVKERLKGHPIEWQVLPGGFDQARRDAKIKGWNEKVISEIYAGEMKEIRALLQQGIPIGLNGLDKPAEVFALFLHNLALTWGWVVGRAAGQELQLSVLDWGGALGNYCVWAHQLRPDLTFDYTIKEVPVNVELGAQVTPEARFVSDVETALERQYDVVLAVASFHYEEHWRELLPRLLKSARKFVFINRIPMTDGPPFVYVQRAYPWGYNTEYPSWCFNYADFMSLVEECGWQLEQEVACGEVVEVTGASGPLIYRGFLLRPRDA